MLLLNISTDQIFLQINDESIHLDRQEIENIIGPTLVKLYKKHNFTKILLINGPGGFTNLRVGTLAVNLLNSLENGKIDIYSITKIDLFKHFVDQNLLPKKGIIYIGQKKNIRLYNFIKGSYDTTTKTDIDYNADIFFDLVYDASYFDTKKNKIDIYMKNGKLILKYNNTELQTDLEKLRLTNKAEKMVEAKYFIKPIMGKQGQHTTQNSPKTYCE